MPNKDKWQARSRAAFLPRDLSPLFRRATTEGLTRSVPLVAAVIVSSWTLPAFGQEAELEGEGNSLLSIGAGPELLFALGILLALSLMSRQLFRAYRRMKKNSPRRQIKAVRQQADKASPRQDVPLTDAPAKYTRWHAEMHEISRSVQAEIDTKLALLDVLIRQAQQVSERLQRQLDRMEQSATGDTDTDLKTTGAKMSEPSQAESDAVRSSDPLWDEQRVRQLFRRGLTAAEIAAQTGLHLSFIEEQIAAAQVDLSTDP